MREAENEGAHIWLRQSATFSVNGQTRTVEMAIPVRPGATAEELELLLSEADAGMERLTRHLDGRVAAIVGEQPGPVPIASSPAAPARTSAPQGTGPAPAPTSRAEPAPSAPATASTPAAAPRPSGPVQPLPTARRDVPTSPPATHAARPLPPTPQAPARGDSSGALGSAAAMPSGPDMSRPEFIKAAGELGLDVRQAMQRLGVRSLEGLNLRESLEVLRRQALRGDEPTSPAPVRQGSPAPSAPAARQAATPVRPAAIPSAPSYSFEEEEDEPELTFTIDGDEDLPDDFGGYTQANGAGETARSEADEYDELDELELDDVPDFGPPAAPAASSGRRSGTPLPAPRAQQTPESESESEPEPATAPQSTAGELIARLRAVHGGGVMSSQQRTAYRNIVVNELGEARASGLLRGIWNVTAERLGAEQADELLSWGKRDTFADEATQVLAELRAERARAAERAAGNGTSAAEPAQRPGSGTRGRPASRRGADSGGDH